MLYNFTYSQERETSPTGVSQTFPTEKGSSVDTFFGPNNSSVDDFFRAGGSLIEEEGSEKIDMARFLSQFIDPLNRSDLSSREPQQLTVSRISHLFHKTVGTAGASGSDIPPAASLLQSSTSAPVDEVNLGMKLRNKFNNKLQKLFQEKYKQIIESTPKGTLPKIDSIEVANYALENIVSKFKEGSLDREDVQGYIERSGREVILEEIIAKAQQFEKDGTVR